jgi:hypothetical protein
VQEHELNAMERLRLIKLEVRVRAETSTQDVISDDHTLGELQYDVGTTLILL